MASKSKSAAVVYDKGKRFQTPYRRNWKIATKRKKGNK